MQKILPSALATALLGLLFAPTVARSGSTPISAVDDDGAVLLANGGRIPYSDLASPEARRNYVVIVRALEESMRILRSEPDAAKRRSAYEEKFIRPGVERLRQTYPVRIESQKIGGVPTDIIEPVAGVPQVKRNRVLISLHGGGMVMGGALTGQMGGIPVAAIGGYRIVSIDYSLAPDHRFPAATQDVEAVYRELLKSYRPENIGIYGCSAGSWLTSSVIAWLIKEKLPLPAAIGMFAAGVPGKAWGDANYIMRDGKPIFTDASFPGPDGYYAEADLANPLAVPTLDEAIARRFPPILFLTGTRDSGLSRVLVTREKFAALGVETDLHVWEGAPHCAFETPVADASVPETRQAWATIIRWFDQHLGKRMTEATKR